MRVAAISLNRGEVRRAMSAEAGWRPGWDLAGTVERAARDGSGPPSGSRVVGFLASGAWAEAAAVPTRALAVLPDAVTFVQAATLPVAGLTALYALEQAALLPDLVGADYRGHGWGGLFRLPAGPRGLAHASQPSCGARTKSRWYRLLARTTWWPATTQQERRRMDPSTGSSIRSVAGP